MDKSHEYRILLRDSEGSTWVSWVWCSNIMSAASFGNEKAYQLSKESGTEWRVVKIEVE